MSVLDCIAAAVGLLLIIEGLVCFSAPSFFRKTLAAMMDLSNTVLQRVGLVAALAGLGLLLIVDGF